MQNTDKQDNLLLKEMAHGNEDALSIVIHRYTNYVGTIVWNITGNYMDKSDAAAVVSQVFYELWLRADRIRPGKLKAYLGRIARSRALDALKKLGREVKLEQDTINFLLPGPEDEYMRRAQFDALRRAVNELGEPDSSIFIRHYYYYQSANDIAAALGINANTVSTKLRRGRDKLRRKLEEGGFSLE